jgi:hypothetical protein
MKHLLTTIPYGRGKEDANLQFLGDFAAWKKQAVEDVKEI